MYSCFGLIQIFKLLENKRSEQTLLYLVLHEMIRFWRGAVRRTFISNAVANPRLISEPTASPQHAVRRHPCTYPCRYGERVVVRIYWLERIIPTRPVFLRLEPQVDLPQRSPLVSDRRSVVFFHASLFCYFSYLCSFVSLF